MFHTSLKIPSRTSFSPGLVQPVKHTWLISLCLPLHWRSPPGHHFLPLTCTVCRTNMSDFSMFRSLLKMPSRTSYFPTQLVQLVKKTCWISSCSEHWWRSLAGQHFFPLTCAACQTSMTDFFHVLQIAEDTLQHTVFSYQPVQPVKHMTDSEYPTPI